MPIRPINAFFFTLRYEQQQWQQDNQTQRLPQAWKPLNAVYTALVCHATFSWFLLQPLNRLGKLWSEFGSLMEFELLDVWVFVECLLSLFAIQIFASSMTREAWRRALASTQTNCHQTTTTGASCGN